MKKCLFTLFILFFISNSFAQITLEGRVVPKDQQTGLKDAILYIDQDKTPYFSLEDGSFNILTNPGEHQIRITKEGFDDLNQQVKLTKSEYVLFELFSKGTSPEDKSIYKALFTDEVIVKATRANAETPTTFTEISSEELNKENLGQDLPYLLEMQPSVVVTSDGGNGVGYTSMRVRGTDMTRINFTINGIPYNDPESQGVFLVNLPDIASSINDIQIQRGVGSSTNGAAAFGASVNINTNQQNKEAYAEFNNSVGSFSTFKNTLKLGSGLIKDHFTFDARFSHIKSDGYIDRASSKLWSYYFSGAYYGDKTIIRFNNYTGRETTYQAWNGVDANTLETDRTFNSAGTDYGYKEDPYENEVDNYRQDHYQLFVSQQIKDNWVANVGLFYTKGEGYFEQYKVQSKLANYNLEDVVFGADTIKRTDLVRRRWLDNDFYGATYSINYKKINKLDFTLGGAWNQYDGDHFGEIIWAQYASNGALNHKYYDNNGLKTDFNIYAKTNWNVSKKFLLFLDLQFRRVSYNVSGIDNDQRYVFHDQDYNFFNPKFGLSYYLTKNSNIYASFAVANREPTRNDFIDNTEEPKAENLYDLEMGYKLAKKSLRFSSNFYYMHYNNQLVLNGSFNDVGSAVRINVDKSFRTGIETTLSVDLDKYAAIDANVSWSVNEIKDYEDENKVNHDNSKIAYSPQWVGALTFEFYPAENFNVALINKFVGKQYLDNSTNESLSLKRYTQNDLRLGYVFHTKVLKDIEFNFLLNNYTNRKIVSNGYVYAGEAYFFPQAGINFMFGLNLRF